MKTTLLLAVFLLVCAFAAFSQDVQMRCDSSYIEIFSKDDFSKDRIPCDTFVVLNRDYYEKIARGYNLMQQILLGQSNYIDNLTAQLKLSEERANQLQVMLNDTEKTLDKYRGLADEYDARLRQSTSLNDSAITNTQKILDVLAKEHKKEVRKARWNGIAIGGVLGVAAGLVVGLLLQN